MVKLEPAPPATSMLSLPSPRIRPSSGRWMSTDWMRSRRACRLVRKTIPDLNQTAPPSTA